MSADVSMTEADASGVDEDMVFEEEGGIRIGDIYIPPPPPPALTFDATGPRLIISNITNENFKSFYGEHVLGPFHKSFTCIVGPNGSGKSNCIDSMLFVFGHRAQKIRSKKVGALIHNSEQHRNVESCTVKVHFKKIIDLPGDDYEDVPGSEFIISRTAMRDNSSYYCINSRRCQFKDVTLQLRTHGIDIDHNRFLILQGEVEQISMMKPKSLTEHDTGMLEYLEDIIGSVRFKVPIEKLAQKVEELNEQRGEKLNRVKVVEKEKDDLEDVKEEALEYLKLENEITKHKNVLYHYYIHESTSKEAKCSEQKEKIDAVMKEILGGLQEVESVQKDVDKEMKKHSIEYEKIQKTLEEAKNKFSEYENQDVRCREDMKHTVTRDKKLANSLKQEKKHLSELESVPEDSQQKIQELKVKRVDHEKVQKEEEEALTAVMNSLHLETKDLQEEKDHHQAKLMEFQKEVDKTKSQMNIAQSEFDIYMSNEQTEKNKFNDMQEKIKSIQTTLEERSKSIKELETNIPNIQKTLDTGKAELTTITGEEQSISKELHGKRLRTEEARSSFQASRSQNKVLNAIMQEKSNGNIHGIFGRLGDLGAIDDKYDVAISTACGALDYIVTDTIDTAQICVDFLKHNNIGMATFIGLDKMQKWISYTKKKITTPEGVPRLFDLVRVKDEKLSPAFYFALRDTLVADSLDQATRIAFQGNTRFRVVTLQGHLIEQSGTMSGGGSRVSRGRMGTTVLNVEFTPDQIERMSNEVQEMTNRLTELKLHKSKLEVSVESQSRKVNEMWQNLERFKLEFKELKQQESSLNMQLKEQAARVKAAAPDQAQVNKLQTTFDSTQKAYEKAAKAASTIEADVQRLHGQIMEITGGRMKKAQKKLDNVNKQIDEVDSGITKAEVAKKTAERNIKKSTTKIKNMENEVQENAEKLTKLKEENKKIEEEAGKLVDIIAAAKEKREECEKKIKLIKEEARKLQESENDLNSRKLDVGHELEQLTNQLRDHHNKINSWKKELKKLALQPIDTAEAETLEEPTSERLQDINSRDIQYQISVCDEKLKQMKPNLAAIAEYKKKEAVYLERVAELEAITEQRDAQRQMHENLRKQRLQDFLTGFGIITSKLKEMYQMITLGGDAELELVDTLDPFAGGIVFSVRPPKKSWKNISNLSGGEKTLSSLALVFALHYYKPTPFYYMDEIDAALDFKNVSIVANYIKEQTKNAQFIIISLRNNMFELADCLVGIFKTHNCSKSVCFLPKTLDIETLARQTIENGPSKEVENTDGNHS